MLLINFGRACLCACLCRSNFCEYLGVELGRIPWSDGMFKVQQLSFSVQRAAKASRLEQRHKTLNSSAVMTMSS